MSQLKYYACQIGKVAIGIPIAIVSIIAIGIICAMADYVENNF
jgi:hypothetical protein